MNQSRLSSYAPLLDTVRGDFNSARKARAPPVALGLNEAPTLDTYVRSIMVEVFPDLWRPAHLNKAVGFDLPRPVAQAGSIRAVQNNHLKTAKVRVTGKLDGQVLVVFGFSTQPPLTSHLLHLYIFLLLDNKCRSQTWILAKPGSEGAYDWRSQDIMDDGDVEIRFNNELMDITYDRTALVFRSRTDAMSSTSSSRSGVTSTSLRRHTPKNDVRIRDEGRCVMSGKSYGSMSILGDIKVAHIIPISSPHIADQLRVTMDPRSFNSAAPSTWRQRAPNHPANLFCLSDSLERLFDEFAISVNPIDPINTTPQFFTMCTTRYKQLMDQESFEYLFTKKGTGLALPQTPFSPTHCPSPSPTLLLIHLLSALAQNCRLSMTDEVEEEDSIEMPRGVPSPALLDYVDQWRADITF